MQNKTKPSGNVRIKIKIALAGCLALVCTSTVTAAAADGTQAQPTPAEIEQTFNRIKNKTASTKNTTGNSTTDQGQKAAAGVQIPIPAEQSNTEAMKGLKLDQKMISAIQENIMKDMAGSGMVEEMQKKVMVERMQSLQNNNDLQGKIQSTMQNSMQQPTQKDTKEQR